MNHRNELALPSLQGMNFTPSPFPFNSIEPNETSTYNVGGSQLPQPLLLSQNDTYFSFFRTNNFLFTSEAVDAAPHCEPSLLTKCKKCGVISNSFRAYLPRH